MKRFAGLCDALETPLSDRATVAAIVRYLGEASDEDAAWAVYLLAGGRPRAVVRVAALRAQAAEAAGLPDWLFDACHQTVGHLTETIAHVLPGPADGGGPLGLHEALATWLPALRGADPATGAARLLGGLRGLDAASRFLLLRLATGGFRVAVPPLLVQRAVADYAGLPGWLVATRLAGYTDARRPPTAQAWRAVVAPADAGAAAQAGRPYPFPEVSALAGGPDDLPGPASDWLAEWTFDGQPCQIVRRAAQVWIWSPTGELLTERVPELAREALAWPDGTVVEGDILAGDAPGVFIARDLLAWQGEDLRQRSPPERRARRDAFARAAQPCVRCAPEVPFRDWADLHAWRSGARALGAAGVRLVRRDGLDGGGGWTWKIDPLTVRGVLLYAQAGRGPPAPAGTECTFAVWSRAPRDAAEAQAVVQAITERRPADPQGLRLLPLARLTLCPSEALWPVIDEAIGRTTLQSFGPVRSLRPTLVAEIAFDGMARSARHKSGVVLRAARLVRVCPDQPLHGVSSLQDLRLT